MCTVSIISLGSPGTRAESPSGFRIVVNRDEQRSRPPAHEPRWREAESTRALWPIDPKGGGTWVAASEHGLVLCLLNRSPEPGHPARPALESRGLIVPRLIAARDPAQALISLVDLDLDRYAPFRLVSAALTPARPGTPRTVQIHEASWDGRSLQFLGVFTPPACFVSSGLGDHRALPRLDVFAEHVLPAPTPEAQDSFHQHVWPGRENVSVLMSRPDARTVSITTIEVMAPREGDTPDVRMSYVPLHENLPAPRQPVMAGMQDG